MTEYWYLYATPLFACEDFGEPVGRAKVCCVTEDRRTHKWVSVVANWGWRGVGDRNFNSGCGYARGPLGEHVVRGDSFSDDQRLQQSHIFKTDGVGGF